MDRILMRPAITEGYGHIGNHWQEIDKSSNPRPAHNENLPSGYLPHR